MQREESKKKKEGGIRTAEGAIFTQIVKSVFPYQYQKKT